MNFSSSQELAIQSEKGKLKEKSQLHKWVPVIADEIKNLFSIILWFEIHLVPSILTSSLGLGYMKETFRRLILFNLTCYWNFIRGFSVSFNLLCIFKWTPFVWFGEVKQCFKVIDQWDHETCTRPHF